MPPSKPACKSLADGYKVFGQLTDKLSDIRDAISSVSKFKTQILYGLVDISDAIGAELLGAVTSITSQVSENILGSVSKMSSEIFNRVFESLLKILLIFPTSVFSLVAIPHDAALKSTIRERRYLRKADESLRRILYIIIKWTKGRSGSDYRKQMEDSLPFIINAIKLSGDLIQGLQGSPTRDGEVGNNSVFKEGVYDRLRSSLRTAIDLSRPESEVEKKLQINKRLENEKKRIYERKASSIKQEYSRRKKNISDEYQDDLPVISGKAASRLQDAIDEQKVTFKYKERLSNLETWKEERLLAADVEAQTEALANKDVWISAVTSVRNQFVIDMKTLEDELFDMLENIKDAFIQYESSRLHCNTIFNIRGIISTLVEEMVAYMRRFGNAAVGPLVSSLETADSYMEVARDRYQDATDPRTNLSSVEYVKELSIGHGSLITAESIIDATVSDGLIDLINQDDVLSAEDAEFDEFIRQLSLIPDWDGETNVWAVDPANASISPYIQLIANITEMLAKTPILSVRNRDSDRSRVNSLMNGVKNDFKTLRRHNSRVMNVLTSYTPYIGSEAGDLMKLLSRAGLLKTFSTTMSLSTLVTTLLSNYETTIGNEFPTYKNCSESYPELFSDEATLGGAVDNKINARDPKLEDEYQARLEGSDLERRIMKSREKLAIEDYETLEDNSLSGIG